jgi:hypothetical protein
LLGIKATMATGWRWPRQRRRRSRQRLKDRGTIYDKKNAGSDYTDAKYRYLEAKRLLEAAQQRYTTAEVQEKSACGGEGVGKAEPALAPGPSEGRFST